MQSLPFIYHGQSSDWLVREGNTLLVTLITDKAMTYSKVMLRHEPDNEEYLIEMVLSHSDKYLNYWTASFELNHDRDVTHYVFKLLTKQGQFWLAGNGVTRRIPAKESHFKYNACHQPPEWVHQQVFYQIFPDRFCNGKPDISVKQDEYLVSGGTKAVVAKQWGEPVDTKHGYGGCEFYGGDLYGVEEKLDYLQQLGVTALYLNPIFTAPSNHKYDCADYLQIDPHLGTNDHFAQLCDNLHQRGMKVMLDAVFNHTSTEHPWFNLQGLQPTSGAYQSPQSPYRDYYFFDGDSHHYIGWKGIQSLPVLNFENQQVRDYIYQSEDSVIKRWLKPPYQIDGWRFDVIHMLGEGEGAKNNAHYVKAFRQAAKQVNPDCYVLGEHFFEASQWLQGDQEDGAMNYYGFAHPVRALLARLDISFDPIEISVNDFVTWQAEARAKLPWQNQLAQLNQLDSHDTARFLELVKHQPELFKIATSMLFSYVGTPCIYYGTEIGMLGSHDPDNRRTMDWDAVEHSDYLPWLQQLIKIRKQSPALYKGDYMTLHFDEQCLVYARLYQGEVVVSAFNLSKTSIEREIPVWQVNIDETPLTNLLDSSVYLPQNGVLKLSLPPLSSALLSNAVNG